MKKIFCIIITMLMMFTMGITAHGDELTDELGIDMDSIQSPAAEDYGITPENTEVMTELSVGEVFAYIFHTLADKAKYPIKVLAALTAVIFAGALISGIGDGISSKPLEQVYGIVSVLICTGVISAPVSSCIDTTAKTLISGSEFMIGYIPVYAGIIASSGSVTSAVSYNAILLVAAEAAARLATDCIVPAMSICMALGIIEAVNPAFRLTSLTDAITKAVRFILGFIMVIFIGLLSLQSIIGTSADTLGVKAAKYLASNCIPVIGSAVADAYTTIKSSLGILRGGTGFFGVAVIFLTVVPPLAEIIIMRAAFALAQVICELLGVKQVDILLKNSSSVLSMMFSVTVCFAVMLIVSTAVMMLTGLSVSQM